MTQASGGASPGSATGVTTRAPRIGHYRWVICAMLFAATGLNYVDRQTIGFLKPALSAQYGWDQTDYAHIVQWFMIAYAFGYVIFGRVIDKIGAKLGYAIAVVIWTTAHLACAILGVLPPALMLTSFMVTQACLGLGQSGNFPAALKATAEWFPQRERALANGIFNAGSNVGAIITPLIVPVVMLNFGWQWAFVATGSLSVIWLVLWIWVYQKPSENKHLLQPERDYIEGDKPEPVKQLPWLKVMRVKETWAFALGKLLTDPVWFFYLFWLPGYFLETYKSQVGNIAGVAAPVIVIYLISDVGSIAGGWMSSAMIKAGFTVNRARKLTMLLCAACVLPVGFAVMFVHNLWEVTFVIGIAAAAHQAFSANLYTIPSDTFPKAAVGSVSGIGGTAGAVGGIIMTMGVAKALAGLGGYSAVFFVAGLIYFLAVLVIHVLTPRLAPAKIGGETPV
jgi:ACS family hexuronate transporter-like MFS transporter